MKHLLLALLFIFSVSANAFSVITPSPDSRLIYVSSSAGSDANDCFSEQTPCKTLAKGRSQMRLGYPDHLYLKSGDTWVNEDLTKIKSGRSNLERAVVTSYGQGARPLLLNAPGFQFLHTGGYGGRERISNMTIKGLEFRVETGFLTVSLMGGHDNVALEDNRFDRVQLVIEGNDTGFGTNIVLFRNIFTGAYSNITSTSRNDRPSNVYADDVTGLQIIENVFDHGGWSATVPGAAANMFNHNLYLQGNNDGKTLVFRGNIVTRGSSHGIQIRSGGVAEDNFLARNAIGISAGYKDYPVKPGVSTVIIGNVVSEGHSMIKGDKPCSFENACTGAVWGIDILSSGGHAWRSLNNIVALTSPEDILYKTYVPSVVQAHFQTGKLNRGAYVRHPQSVLPVEQSGNVAYRFTSDEEGADASHVDPNRTLASYSKVVGLDGTFDGFMQAVLNRAPGQWEYKFSAYAINQYIRDGFKPRVGPVPPKVIKMNGDITCTIE